MIAGEPVLDDVLRVAAAGQAAIAVMNLFLVRILRWEEEVNRMPLLVREVFTVHSWFITITLLIFATMTWRFADVMWTNPVCQWLSGAIAVFWGIRTAIQIAYYSSSHWRGQPSRYAVHVILLIVYGGFTVVYAEAARDALPW